MLERRSGQRFFPEHSWENSARWASRQFRAAETHLKGPEGELPDGASFLDKGGTERNQARLRWWAPVPATLGDAMLFQNPPEGLDLDAPYQSGDHAGYPETAPPVFFGHYWRSGPIQPVRPNAICLDYSVAKKGGRLVPYRWCGEERIQPARFVSRSPLAA